MIRLKEGLLRMSGAYCDLSNKSNIVFTAQKVSYLNRIHMGLGKPGLMSTFSNFTFRLF